MNTDRRAGALLSVPCRCPPACFAISIVCDEMAPRPSVCNLQRRPDSGGGIFISYRKSAAVTRFNKKASRRLRMAARRRNSKIELRFLYQGGRTGAPGRPAGAAARPDASAAFLLYFPTSTSMLLSFFPGVSKLKEPPNKQRALASDGPG